MLIGIDASRANSDQKTGVEWYGFFIIQELKKIIPAEHRVILYTREPLQGALDQLPGHWQERVLKWPPHRLWTQFRLFWEMVRRPPDVLFVPAHVLPLRCPARTVLTVHDSGGLRFPAGYSWFERWYSRWSIRWALRHAAIITPSQFSQEEMLYLFKKDNPRIQVIPNAFDRQLFRLINDRTGLQKILDKYHLRQPFFLSISRLEEKKNTLGIVRAFELFKKSHSGDYTLALLGKAGYGFKDVRQAINLSPYKKDIILPGWVATEDVPYLMNAAEAFVFPSFYEGFGIPILEAMACGLPVVASNTASCPEVAAQAAILVNPYKPIEISRALVSLVDSSELKNSLKQAGVARAAGFNWAASAQAVWQILQSARPMLQ